MNKYYCDKQRHLVCVPFSIPNLHAMAQDLGIKRCWYHNSHYDIPKRRIAEIQAKCTMVSSREILSIIALERNPKIEVKIDHDDANWLWRHLQKSRTSPAVRIADAILGQFDKMVE